MRRLGAAMGLAQGLRVLIIHERRKRDARATEAAQLDCVVRHADGISAKRVRW